jgi:acyl carrier protein
LGEIEAVLERHPQVRQAVVVTRAHGPGDIRLVGYVVAQADAAPTFDELRRALRAELPEYMVPSQFVCLAALPLTQNGKVDRSALPEPDATPQGTAELAPRTPMEATLAGIWTEVLGLQKVGVRDNFFEIGGHSLLAVQILIRLREELNVDVSLASIFEVPTVEQLARRIEALQYVQQTDQDVSADLEEVEL